MINLKRRHVVKGIGASAGLLAMPGIVRGQSAGELNIISYQDHIPRAFREAFEDETGIRLNIRLSDDSAKVFALLAAEASNPITDVSICSPVVLPSFLDADLFSPLDKARLANLDRVLPSYLNSEGMNVGGELWGVPTLFGCQTLAFNEDRLPGVTSWDSLFDEANSGRISWRLTDFLVIVLHYLGYDGNLLEYMGDDARAQEVVNIGRDFLISKKPYVRTMYSGNAEIEQLFVNEEVYISNMWSGPATKLILDGFPLKRIIPVEGSFGFSFSFNVVKGAPHEEAAYRFLNAYLDYPDIGELTMRATGFGSAMADATANMNETERAAYAFSDEEFERLGMFREDNVQVRDALFRRAEAEILAS